MSVRSFTMIPYLMQVLTHSERDIDSLLGLLFCFVLGPHLAEMLRANSHLCAQVTPKSAQGVTWVARTCGIGHMQWLDTQLLRPGFVLPGKCCGSAQGSLPSLHSGPLQLGLETFWDGGARAQVSGMKANPLPTLLSL